MVECRYEDALGSRAVRDVPGLFARLGGTWLGLSHMPGRGRKATARDIGSREFRSVWRVQGLGSADTSVNCRVQVLVVLKGTERLAT